MKKSISLKDGALFAALILLTLCVVLLIAGRGQGSGGVGEPRSRLYYEYFDTVSTVYDYSGESDESFARNADEMKALLDYYHKLFDIYNEYDGITNLCTLNKMAGKGMVEVDAELIDFLEYSVEMHELTDGHVNVAMGAVLSIWHKYRTEGVAIPTREELLSAAEHIDIANLVIDRENSAVEIVDPEMSLDVGAIAKGYAVEKMAERLTELGASGYVLDVGGNLRALGTKPDGSGWRTGVQNPDVTSSDRYAYILDVSDTSVVTSGDYQRYYTVDGVSYHHIINKDTLMPATYYSSVTVVTENSGFADALSTALFNMEYDEGLALLNTIDDVKVVWVFPNGEVRTFGLE